MGGSDLDRANVFSLLFFSFLSRILSIGKKRGFIASDLGDIPSHQKLAVLLEKSDMFNGAFSAKEFSRLQMKRIIILTIGCIINLCTVVTAPFAIDYVLKYIQQSRNSTEWSFELGLGMVFLLFICQYLNSLTYNNAYFIETLVGTDFKTMFTYFIYRKTMLVAPSYAPDAGDVLTYLSVDIERIWDFFNMSHWLILAPLTVIAVLIALSWFVGWPAFLAIAVFLVISFINQRFSMAMANLREKALIATEARAGMVTEVLAAVRTLKSYGWSDQISRIRVTPLRLREISKHAGVLFLNGLTGVTQVICPILMVGIVLIVATSVNKDLKINVSLVYTVLAFINSLMTSAEMFPYAVSFTTDASVSYRRLLEFLQRPEVQALPSPSALETSQQTVAVLQNASLGWRSSDRTPCIANVNVSIKKGELVFVVGETGTGKSCLMLSLCGRVSILSGQCRVTSRISMATQESWVRNATIRSNILFGRPYDDTIYKKVVSAAQLTTDLLSFPLGDEQPVGEKGRTLSGGQQARLAIARAFYAALVPAPFETEIENGDGIGAELVLLDDPLAALDTKTAAGVIKDGIEGLLLKDAKRAVVICLNSHYHLLSRGHNIIVLNSAISPNTNSNDVQEIINDNPIDINASNPSPGGFFNREFSTSRNKIAAQGSFEEVKSTPECLRLLNNYTDDLKLNPKQQSIDTDADFIVRQSPPMQPILNMGDNSNIHHSNDFIHDSISLEGLQLRAASKMRSVSHTSAISFASPSAKPMSSSFVHVADAAHAEELYDFQLDNATDDVLLEDDETPSLTTALIDTQTGMVEDVKEEGTVSLKVHLFYLQRALSTSASLKSYFPALLCVLLLIIFFLVPATRWSADYILGLWAEGKVAPDRSDAQWLSIYLGMAVLVLFVGTAKELTVAFTAYRASKNMHNAALEGVLRASIPNFFDSTPLGRILHRFTRDMDSIDSRLPQCYNYAISGLIQSFALILTCIIAVPWFAIVIPFIAVVYYVVQKAFRKCSVELKRLDAQVRAPLASAIEEIAESPLVPTLIRTLGMDKLLIKQFMPMAELSTHTSQTFGMLCRWFAIRLDTVACLMTLVAGVLLVVIRKIDDGALDPKLAGMTLSYIIQMAGAFQWSTRQWIEAENHLTACERIGALERTAAEAPLHQGVPALPDGYDVNTATTTSGYQLMASKQEQHINIVENGKSYDKENNDVLSLRNYCLRYRPNLPLVLKNISFSLPPGRRLAVVGRSGAGKSTLTQAVLRLVEGCSGSLSICGKDNRSLGLSELRGGRWVSLVPQEPVVLTGSLRDNLDPLHANGKAEDDIFDYSFFLRNSHEHHFKNDAMNEELHCQENEEIIPNSQQIKNKAKTNLTPLSSSKRQLLFDSILRHTDSDHSIQKLVDSLEEVGLWSKFVMMAEDAACDSLICDTSEETHKIISRLREFAVSVSPSLPPNRFLTNSQVMDWPRLIRPGSLSLGESQLLCISRALVRDAKLLLLDEATASVDAATSLRVQTAVAQATRKGACAGMAVMMIAHRLDTAVDADEVMVMGGGEIIEIGTPKDLLSGRAGVGALKALVESAGQEELRRVAAVIRNSTGENLETILGL